MSFTDEFAKPAAPGGDPLDLHALLGSLLVFEVTEDIDHIQTAFTEPGQKTSAVRADVYVIDGPHSGMTRKDALVFPRVLQGQLRPSIGRKVLGRIARGEAKKGQSAPWVLQAATDADLAKAADWSRAQAAGQFAGPSSSTGSEAPF